MLYSTVQCLIVLYSKIQHSTSMDIMVGLDPLGHRQSENENEKNEKNEKNERNEKNEKNENGNQKTFAGPQTEALETQG